MSDFTTPVPNEPSGTQDNIYDDMLDELLSSITSSSTSANDTSTDSTSTRWFSTNSNNMIYNREGSTTKMSSYSNPIGYEELKRRVIGGEHHIRYEELAVHRYELSAELTNLLKEHGFYLIYRHFRDMSESSSSSGMRRMNAVSNNHLLDLLLEDYLIEHTTKEKPRIIPSKNLSNSEVVDKVSKVKVGISYPFSFGTFKALYPNIELIKDKDAVKNYDLIVVPGGEDVNPYYYGQTNKYSDYNKVRDEREVPIVDQAMRMGKKLFGTCRGHQLINILNRCTFTQDLLSGNLQPHSGRHPIEIVKQGSVAERFFNKDVVSMHHQAVISVNNAIRVTSRHKGVVESCESYNNNIITTQFHPEFQEGNEGFFKYLLYWSLDLEYYYK